MKRFESIASPVDIRNVEHVPRIPRAEDSQPPSYDPTVWVQRLMNQAEQQTGQANIALRWNDRTELEDLRSKLMHTHTETRRYIETHNPYTRDPSRRNQDERRLAHILERIQQALENIENVLNPKAPVAPPQPIAAFSKPSYRPTQPEVDWAQYRGQQPAKSWLEQKWPSAAKWFKGWGSKK